MSPTVAAHWARAVAVHARLIGAGVRRAGRGSSRAGRPGAAGRRAVRATRTPAAALRLIAEQRRARRSTAARSPHALAELAAATGGLLTADDLAAHTQHLGRADQRSTTAGTRSGRCRPTGRASPRCMALGILDGSTCRRGAGAAAPADRGDEARLRRRARATWPIPSRRTCRCRTCSIRPTLADAARADRRPGRATRRPATRRAAAPSTSARPTRDGMMVSLIQSNYMGFGSVVVLPGYGFGAAEPRRRLHPRPGPPERRRARQAAVPHDHPRLPDPRRRSRSGRSG